MELFSFGALFKGDYAQLRAVRKAVWGVVALLGTVLFWQQLASSHGARLSGRCAEQPMENDGRYPEAGLIQDAEGFLYGTTSLGGSRGLGGLFKINQDGGQYRVIYSFNEDLGGGDIPEAPLVLSTDGALYGTTVSGGVEHRGTIFKVNKDGTHYRTLFSFRDNDYDYDYNDYYYNIYIIQGADGALYGTQSLRGPSPFGCVFRVNRDGSQFHEILTFSKHNGAEPNCAVIQGADGALYGTTRSGGPHDKGIVFKVKTDGSDFQIIHAFRGEDGYQPRGSLIQDSNGVLYGTTQFGGPYGDGVVFRVNPNGSHFQVLHGFRGSDGSEPFAGVILGSDGYLYGTTSGGGANASGVVFKLRTDGRGFTLLHTFKGEDGYAPYANLLEGQDKALYGTTYQGGAKDKGVLFKLNRDGSNFQVLHAFSG